MNLFVLGLRIRSNGEREWDGDEFALMRDFARKGADALNDLTTRLLDTIIRCRWIDRCP